MKTKKKAQQKFRRGQLVTLEWRVTRTRTIRLRVRFIQMHDVGVTVQKLVKDRLYPGHDGYMEVADSEIVGMPVRAD